MKLNLGSGQVNIEGFENVDRKLGTEVYPLPDKYADNSIEEIRASHILEHFSQREVCAVIRHWVTKLKVGGRIKIAVPNFEYIAKRYLAKEKINTHGFIMGGQVDDDDYHKSLFDEDALRKLMVHSGLRDIKLWKCENTDSASQEVSLNLEGVKQDAKTFEIDPKTIGVVMSMPRLGFTANAFATMKSFGPMGIGVKYGCGAFWEQVLSRLIQEFIAEGVEYIITIDYDTWFQAEHVYKMLQLMVENPSASAIAPVEQMRERENILAGGVEHTGSPLSRVDAAHFGLTIFRAEAFQKLNLPWLHGQPNSDGVWGKGRTDPDIYFWENFKNNGLELYLANEVCIGHLQMMCTFPGSEDNEFEPIHCYMNDVERSIVPKHCIPEL